MTKKKAKDTETKRQLLDNLLRERSDLQGRVITLSDHIRKLGGELAALECEFKVGDRVVNSKARESVAIEITRIEADTSYMLPGKGLVAVLFGRKVKKDGTLHALEQRLYSHYTWKKA